MNENSNDPTTTTKMRAKALEWTRETPFHIARTAFGFYSVEHVDYRVSYFELKGTFIWPAQKYLTVNEAKSAAQADFEARVMSAIETNNLTGEMIEAACAAVMALRGYEWPSSCDEEEQRIARENMSAAIKAAIDQAPAPAPQMTGRWRMFEEATGPGYWGIELEDAGNDDDAILYPIKAHRDTIAQIVEAHNAALATSEGRSELVDKYDTGTTS